MVKRIAVQPKAATVDPAVAVAQAERAKRAAVQPKDAKAVLASLSPEERRKLLAEVRQEERQEGRGSADVELLEDGRLAIYVTLADGATRTSKSNRSILAECQLAGKEIGGIELPGGKVISLGYVNLYGD